MEPWQEGTYTPPSVHNYAPIKSIPAEDAFAAAICIVLAIVVGMFALLMDGDARR